MASEEAQQPAGEGVDVPVLLTPADVAALLRIPHRTVYQWIDSGLLPCHRLGKRLLRIFREDALALLQRLPGSEDVGADTTVDDERDSDRCQERNGEL